MNKEDLVFFEKNNIKTSLDFKFISKEERLNFLYNLNQILKHNINIYFINNDIKDIITQLEINDYIIKTLFKINWINFKNLILENSIDKSDLNRYNNFIDFLREILNLKNNKLFEKKELNLEEDLLFKSKKYNIDIVFDYNKKGQKNTIQDFILYFNNRLDYFTQLLKNKVNLENLTRISSLKDFSNNEKISIIGLVNDFRFTQNGHFMILLEDKSGLINCLINKNKLSIKSSQYDSNLANIVKKICFDEVIAIEGKLGKDIIWVDDIILLSPLNILEKKNTNDTNYIAIISDIHIGSKLFQEESFNNFIKFLNGETKNDKLNNISKKIKYLLVVGDMIDGVGIYPNQKEDILFTNSILQYNYIAKYLDKIRKDICIIVIPGNHDSTRVSEPQLKLSYEKAYSLYNLENLVCLSNPSIINILSLNLYLYHGGSLFYYADKIDYLRQNGGINNQIEIIKFLFEKHHIAPSHGSIPYLADSQNDHLILKLLPDLFLFGHTHKLDISNYNNSQIINPGSWSKASNYQKEMGIVTDIGKCVLINTKTRKPTILNFNKKNE